MIGQCGRIVQLHVVVERWKDHVSVILQSPWVEENLAWGC